MNDTDTRTKLTRSPRHLTDEEVAHSAEVLRKLRTINAEYVAAVAALDVARHEWRAVIAEATYARGIPQVKIVEETGKTREHIRRVVAQYEKEMADAAAGNPAAQAG
jgi:hypothetical protein